MASTAKGFSYTMDVTGTEAQTWTLPYNATAVDGAYATQIPKGYAVNRIMRSYDYRFAIPSTATITGVQLEIGRLMSGGTNGDAYDDIIQLLVGGTGTGDNKSSASAWSTGLTTQVYGGPADMWGLVLTPAICNATDFGNRVRLYGSPSSTTDRIANIDSITMQVFYTDAAVSGPPGNFFWATWGLAA